MLETRRRGDNALLEEPYQEAIHGALESPEIATYLSEQRVRELAARLRERVALQARGQRAALQRAISDLHRLRQHLNRYLVLSVLVVAALLAAALVLVALTPSRPLLGLAAGVVIVLAAGAALQFRSDILERVRHGRERFGVPGWSELRSRVDGAESLVLERRQELQDALFQGLMPHLREEVARKVARGKQTIWFDRAKGLAPGLVQPFDVAFHVTTPTGERLVRLLQDLDGGSLALAGARGTGKTGLIEAIVTGHYAEVALPVAVVMPAPVQYEPRDFVLQLFAAACERTRELAERTDMVPRRSAGTLRTLRRDAERQLNEIRYQQTLNVQLTQPLLWTSLTLGRGRTRRELTYPEIVERFRRFLKAVATALMDGSADDDRERLSVPVLIAIDELDRMGSAENARTFLNEVKGAFSIRGCQFIVSVADETMQTFELAGTPLDVVVDRAFDEVVHMDYLDLSTVRRLLIRRVAPPFRESHVALCYCLSGGIARDVVRTARIVAGVGRERPSRNQPPDLLSSITAEVVFGEVQNGVRWGRNALLRTGIEPMATNTIRWMDPWWDVAKPDGMLLRTELLRMIGYRLPAGSPVEIATVWERLLTLAYFLLTVMDVFRDDLDESADSLGDVQVRHLGILARSRRALRANDSLARTLLDHFRTEWGLPPF